MEPARVTDRRLIGALVAILCAALSFRLIWILWINPNPDLIGGDALFYLSEAKLWAQTGEYPAIRMQAVGPLYVVLLAFLYRLLPEALVIQSARILQAIIDTTTCLIAFDLGRRLFNIKVGLVVVTLLAIDLRLVVQAGEIYTETLIIFFLVAGTWTFVILRNHPSPGLRHYSVTAVLFLLAAFTRAIVAPLPFLLFGSLILPRPTRTQLIAMLAIIIAGLVAVIGYGMLMYQLNGTFVVISDGLTSNFWMGSRGDGDWPGGVIFQEDINLLKAKYGGRAAYLEDAFETIAADPLAYIRLLGLKFVRAYTQPHGTVAFGGESLKDLIFGVAAGQASLGQVINQGALLPKLYIYFLHYFGLVAGVVAMWLTRKQRLTVFPLTLPIFYFSITYTLLTIIPRYLFPLAPFFTLLAAYAVVTVWDARKASQPVMLPVV
jgi:hypothetical protein